MINDIYILIVGIIVTCLTIGSIIYTHIRTKKINIAIENKIKNSPSTVIPDNIHLSFEECNRIIDNVIEDIWKNKYFLSYRLRDLTIIPNMDNEITDFTKEVLNSISDRVKVETMRYYSHDYMITRITRQAQMLFVDYIDKFKPSTK